MVETKHRAKRRVNTGFTFTRWPEKQLQTTLNCSISAWCVMTYSFCDTRQSKLSAYPIWGLLNSKVLLEQRWEWLLINLRPLHVLANHSSLSPCLWGRKRMTRGNNALLLVNIANNIWLLGREVVGLRVTFWSHLLVEVNTIAQRLLPFQFEGSELTILLYPAPLAAWGSPIPA